MGKTRKPPASEKTVLEFCKSVYPEMTELAMSTGTEETILKDATGLIASIRAELEEVKGKLCRARDVDGITTVIIETYEQRKYDSEKDDQYRQLFVRDAEKVVAWINSPSPCSHEEENRKLKRALHEDGCGFCAMKEAELEESNKENEELNTAISHCVKENRRLREEVRDLKEAFGKVECLYCGQAEKEEDMKDDHWKTCEQHPSHEEIRRLREAVEWVIKHPYPLGERKMDDRWFRDELRRRAFTTAKEEKQ